MYPAQVRVEYCPRCPPMEEQYFKPAIAANYFNPNRFRWELNERQASMPQLIAFQPFCQDLHNTCNLLLMLLVYICKAGCM